MKSDPIRMIRLVIVPTYVQRVPCLSDVRSFGPDAMANRISENVGMIYHFYVYGSLDHYVTRRRTEPRTAVRTSTSTPKPLQNPFAAPGSRLPGSRLAARTAREFARLRRRRASGLPARSASAHRLSARSRSCPAGPRARDARATAHTHDADRTRTTRAPRRLWGLAPARHVRLGRPDPTRGCGCAGLLAAACYVLLLLPCARLRCGWGAGLLSARKRISRRKITGHGPSRVRVTAERTQEPSRQAFEVRLCDDHKDKAHDSTVDVDPTNMQRRTSKKPTGKQPRLLSPHRAFSAFTPSMFTPRQLHTWFNGRHAHGTDVWSGHLLEPPCHQPVHIIALNRHQTQIADASVGSTSRPRRM